VRAGSEACLDCLVPRDLFRRIVEDRLRGAEPNREPLQIEVVYPEGSMHA
jgi:hypothetical protein